MARLLCCSQACKLISTAVSGGRLRLLLALPGTSSSLALALWHICCTLPCLALPFSQLSSGCCAWSCSVRC